jgi:hypothetical protein
MAADATLPTDDRKSLHERANAFGMGCAGLVLLFAQVESIALGLPLALWSTAAIAHGLLVSARPPAASPLPRRLGYIAAYGVSDALAELDALSRPQGRLF